MLPSGRHDLSRGKVNDYEGAPPELGRFMMARDARARLWKAPKACRHSVRLGREHLPLGSLARLVRAERCRARKGNVR